MDGVEPDAREVFDELCQLVEEAAELYLAEQRSLPPPLVGKEFVNALQRIA